MVSDRVEHGFQFLSVYHWDDEHEGYDWVLSGRDTDDDTRYGHAFVVLAAARTTQAGISEARTELERAIRVIDDRFFEPEYGM